jgi:hypothetical protein
MTDLIPVKVLDCLRCGRYHYAVMFRPLSRPTTRWRWWGMCPETNEPLLAFEDGDDATGQGLTPDDPDPDAVVVLE